MKKTHIVLLLTIIVFQTIKGQSNTLGKETKKIISKRDLYINGGLRSEFGGKSRVYIKLDLPPNTIEWYYAFSTSLGKSGTKNLDLAIQLTGLLNDPTGITSNIVSEIEIPKGEASADVYLIDTNNLDPFLKKTSFKYFPEGMVENTKQAVVKIDDIKSGTWYLGIKNPSSLNAINFSIEVIAIIENKITENSTEKLQKAEMYGNLGWKIFEKGEYQKCIEYCNKSNTEYQLGWVQANKALATLMLGYESSVMDLYIDAITLIKKQPHSNYVFNEMIKDIDNATLLKEDLSNCLVYTSPSPRDS